MNKREKGRKREKERKMGKKLREKGKRMNDGKNCHPVEWKEAEITRFHSLPFSSFSPFLSLFLFLLDRSPQISNPSLN